MIMSKHYVKEDYLEERACEVVELGRKGRRKMVPHCGRQELNLPSPVSSHHRLRVTASSPTTYLYLGIILVFLCCRDGCRMAQV